MRIAIIGTGAVGTALAAGLTRSGHEVVFGSRDPHAARVADLAAACGARVAAPADAAAEADIVVLALPWRAMAGATAALGDLAGRIVIDCSNPLGMVDGALGLTLGFETSGGETVQRLLPRARVVKTLNQVGAEIMADPSGLPVRPVMFMAGNDPAAKEAVAGLLQEIGFAPLDAGDIALSRLLEPFGMLWINQALRRGKGRHWAFAAIDRPEGHRP
jgi:predicted dinucleotide-binding enzyme